MNQAVVSLIVILISIAIFLGIFITVSIVRSKYRKFVENQRRQNAKRYRKRATLC